MPSNARLRNRALIGFGRLFRGTAQAVFIAFCVACATPRLPYNAPNTPTTTAAPLPRNPVGLRSWVPIPGNWLNAECRICCSKCGWPPSTNPSTEVNNNSNGNNDRNP